MKNFQNGQRIVVAHPEHPCVGKVGTVVRLLRRDESAWVNMDDDLPLDLRSFGVEDSRRNHINLWPDECAAHPSRPLPQTEGEKQPPTLTRGVAG